MSVNSVVGSHADEINSLLHQNNYLAAEQYLTQLLSRGYLLTAKQKADAFVKRAFARMHLRLYVAAENDYREALALRQSSPAEMAWIWVWIACIREKQLDFILAETYFTQAIDSGQLSRQQQANAIYGRARVRTALQNFKEAQADYDSIIDCGCLTEQRNGSALLYRAEVLQLQYKFNEAEADLNRIIAQQLVYAEDVIYAYSIRASVRASLGKYWQAACDCEYILRSGNLTQQQQQSFAQELLIYVKSKSMNQQGSSSCSVTKNPILAVYSYKEANACDTDFGSEVFEPEPPPYARLTAKPK